MSVTPPSGPTSARHDAAQRSERPGTGRRPGRRSRRTQDLEPEEFRSGSRSIGWLLLAIIVSYTGLQLPLPWRLLALIAGLAGLVAGVVFLVQCFRRRLPALMHISAIAAVLCCGMFTMTATVQTVFWQATAAFDDCVDSALTERSERQCYTELEDDMTGLFPGM